MKNIIDFLDSTNNKEVRFFVDKLLGSDNLDERMSLCDDIIDALKWLEEQSDFDYQDFVDAVKELAIS